jgi:hypothetical protein
MTRREQATTDGRAAARGVCVRVQNGAASRHCDKGGESERDKDK